MSHALHGKGSFAHADTFIIVVSKEYEAHARRTLDEVLAHDNIVRDYISRGGKVYLCVREHGRIEEVYEVRF